MHLDLLTVNLWGLPWPLSRHRRQRKRRFAEHLRGRAYDLVGIQELWWPWRRSLGRAPLLVPPSRRDSGLALGGRLRIADARVEHFQHHEGFDRLKRKGVLRASAEGPGGTPLSIAVVHLQAGRRCGRVRARQVEQLLRGLESDRRPLLLLGDFNLYADVEDDRRNAARLHAAGFQDAALALDRREPTFGPSNPYARHGEQERFDRVYLRDAPGVRLQPLEAEVVRGGRPLSDHHPLRVRVRLSG